MTSLALFFVGSVYLLNGLSFLGLIDAKASAPLNILIGGILLAVTAAIVKSGGPAGVEQASLAEAAGFLLFALAFVYTGIGGLWPSTQQGVGWYCAWAAAVSACLSGWHIIHDANAKSSILWAVWTVVFVGLFLVIVVPIDRLRKPMGWFLIAAGFTTCFVPGGLGVLGIWSTTSDVVVLAIEVAAIGFLAALAFFGGGSSRRVLASQR